VSSSQFITPGVSQSEMPIRIVHRTARIEIVPEDGSLWFEFVAMCRSNELIKAINTLGPSERSNLKAGVLVPCEDCEEAWQRL